MKEKLKVYHGLPKTPITNNTLFYASYDGKPDCDYGSATKPTYSDFYPMPTGYGLMAKTPTVINIEETSILTVEFWVDFNNWKYTESPNNTTIYDTRFISFNGTSSTLGVAMRKYKSSNAIAFNFGTEDVFIKRNSKNITDGIHHIRIILNEKNTTLYVNGLNQGTYKHSSSYTFSPIQSVNFFRGKTASVTSYLARIPVSDLHMYQGDLGDYFPTLPQDFIDGKAIVVPALNQRQSYGDPILHQVTELLVPKTETGQYYPYSNTADSDGLFPSLFDPGLATYGADTWNSGSKLKITGLNKSIITGVFDTDTAKAKVIKSSYAPNTKLYLDTVDGLSVGDTIVLAEVTSTEVWMTEYITIQGINTTEKSITITSTDWNVTAEKHYIFETTASSSSPVVKTVDGTTVNGTWSGLGTHQATFTLGSNSNIAGKDLVVTYCLNARGNSSPYPKMPSEVIRGYNELGHELVPANEIVIQDDFRGKVSGSTETCPHTLKWSFTNSFNGLSGTEFAQAKYNSLNDPTDYVQSGTDISGEYPKHIVSIDLIKVVENKFGCEIPGNKVNWLKNNISVTTCYFDCYGWLQGSNYYVEARYYMPDNKNWSTNSGTSHRHSESDFKYIHVNGGAGVIDSEGKIHFLVTTNASNGSASYLRVKDIYFKVTFTKSDIYDYLYPKNTHARFGEKGNPILVDKQTKEVKRLLPSTAPFSTEVLLHSPTKQDKRFEDLELLYDPSHTYITTHGTGTSCPTYDVFRGLVAKLDMSALFPHKLLNENLFNSPVTNADYRSSKIKRVLSQPYPSNFNFDSVEDAYEVDSVYLSPRLVQYGKEVYLYVLAYQLDCTNCRDNSATTQVIYKLPNRPLIK